MIRLLFLELGPVRLQHNQPDERVCSFAYSGGERSHFEKAIRFEALVAQERSTGRPVQQGVCVRFLAHVQQFSHAPARDALRGPTSVSAECCAESQHVDSIHDLHQPLVQHDQLGKLLVRGVAVFLQSGVQQAFQSRVEAAFCGRPRIERHLADHLGRPQSSTDHFVAHAAIGKGGHTKFYFILITYDFLNFLIYSIFVCNINVPNLLVFFFIILTQSLLRKI
jgi:hypothetical protein